ncbi:folate-binding protein YgfZ [Leucobacter sp. cx-328]|uniref:CAF17-like 4Fe-4S cluster assembly/insertion protein YgfZ n=1 Tax=unclassified Leucobacter TaxID=2621730 RepID=UPI00165EB908|nr:MULTISPECIES: folate-binding protein YgfZ [unclassified Leucobacter]MBC9943812.1 folate-binding protein YgfZ [Leucobacter sp. cx-328]
MHLPGAVALGERDVAAHYGSPLPEQRALKTGQAIVDLSDHAVVTVSGPDRLSWLHSFTSQHLLGVQPGEGVETLLLDPNGRIQHAIRLVDDGETAWLIVAPTAGDDLTNFLMRMRFALRVEVTNVTADYAVVGAFDAGDEAGADHAAAHLRALGTAAAQWRDPWASLQRGGVQYARGEHPGTDWSFVASIFPRVELTGVVELIEAGKVSVAGTLALDPLEIRAWRPNFASDVDERAIPHEFDWLRTAVHLNKGCYRGQETVAKVHNLGHPPRRIVMLHLDGSAGELPAAGALVYRAGESANDEARPVGRITRAANHYEWGPIALALVKRGIPEDAALEVRTEDSGEIIAATPEVIVPSDAGATANIPKLKRI